VIAGPPRAGKTTLVRYIQYGIFQHAEETQRTYDPIESQRFNLQLGADKKLEVSVKTAVDLPGQYGVPLADAVFERRPHALVILLDVSRELDGDDDGGVPCAGWLTNFCIRFDQRWLADPGRNRLRCVIVAMNKMDLVPADAMTTAERAYKQIMAQHWKASRGPHTDEPLFRPAVTVENPDGMKWVDSILVDLATSLTRKR